jgi:5'-nucleotidase
MRILVTNDDGIDSVGLHVLARTVARHGEVIVAAPDSEYSGAGAALGALHVIRPEVHEVALEGVDAAYAVTGPPALCVMFAALEAFGPKPDLIVSGINPGANVGRAVYHSGTVGAALTGRNRGIPGVAISQDVADLGVEGQGWEDQLAAQRWDSAAAVADVILDGLLAHPPETPYVLNVNVPNLPVEAIVGWRYAEVGTIPPRTMAVARLEPKPGHEGSYRVNMEWGDPVILPPETDGGTVEGGYVSLSWLSRITHVDVEVGGLERALEGLLG